MCLTPILPIGAVGAFAGGVIGLARGIPLTKSLPSSAFRTAALLGTVSGRTVIVIVIVFVLASSDSCSIGLGAL